MTAVAAPRILVVEDEPEVISVLSDLLARDGYKIEQARHGAEALVHLTVPQAQLPDLVLLDVNLPLEGGVRVLEFIRSTLRSPVPVIVLTASATEQEEKKIADLGVSAFLRKPDSADLILSQVRRSLAKAPTRHEPALS
ncbi:MAG: response regulator [Armatimonadetes bacterium]|nr:response regulator [Armatimonadota bacterium]